MSQSEKTYESRAKQMLADGYSNRVIAATCGISARTVRKLASTLKAKGFKRPDAPVGKLASATSRLETELKKLVRPVAYDVMRNSPQYSQHLGAQIRVLLDRLERGELTDEDRKDVQDAGYVAAEPKPLSTPQPKAAAGTQLGRFMSECLVTRPYNRVKTVDVFKAYTKWCAEKGEEPEARTSQKLTRMLRAEPLEFTMNSKEDLFVVGKAFRNDPAPVTGPREVRMPAAMAAPYGDDTCDKVVEAKSDLDKVLERFKEDAEIQLKALKPSERAFKPTDTEEVSRLKAEIALLRKDNLDTIRKYKQALQGDIGVERLCQAIRENAPRAYETAPMIGLGRRTTEETSPQTAVVLLGDTHVGKVVYPNQTLGFGKYDIQTYLDRLQTLEDTVVSILTEHVVCEIPELYVIMLGDMIDGALNHGNEADQMTTITKQVSIAGHSLAQMIRSWKQYFPKITIVPVCGNHTRMTHQKRVPAKNKNSSFDTMTYELAAALTRDLPGVEWQMSDEPSKLVTINGSVFYVSHGDHLQGGDKALGLPSHSIARQLMNLTQNLASRGSEIPHYYCFGHFHREMTLPHANGKIFVNGGFPGPDEFGMRENFPMVPAEQKLLLVHPKFRVNANWPIFLEHAPEGCSRYDMRGIV